MTFKLPERLQLGVASAATQIEGGELNHSWNLWYHRGKIKDGSNPANANQHYKYFKEDIELMATMGIKHYRLGLEWARIQPHKGEFDMAVLEHYLELILLLKANDIQPLVTLHHFTNPMWFEELGGWTTKRNVTFYLQYVDIVVRYFGENVHEYITINEPNVYAMNGYFDGSWPPGEKNIQDYIKVLNNMAYAHIRAYRLIHSIHLDKNIKVSFAHHMRVFEPKNRRNPKDVSATKFARFAFQTAISEMFILGKFTAPFMNIGKLPRGQYVDFLAVNYYSRSSIDGLKDGVKSAVPVNDLGWEIYPQGLLRVIRELYSVAALPIYVTENGTCDNFDRFRSKYIYDHLKVLTKTPLPVLRYYHWCFVDNFEWLEGESARFGLVHNNYETQERTIKDSGHFYSRLIKDREVTKDVYEYYVAKQTYPDHD